MFTGIVEELGAVTAIEDADGLHRLTLRSATATDGLAVGDSVAVNGVCLTAVTVAGAEFTVEAIPETLRRSNLGGLIVGDHVNMERSMPAGGRFGGHLVQGHVDSAITLATRRPEGAAELLTFDTPADLMRYIVEKGYVAVDGVSLTVVDVTDAAFSVALIPHTMARVTLGGAAPGYLANLEVDIMAKYVERLAGVRTGAPVLKGVKLEHLRDAGFMPDEPR